MSVAPIEAGRYESGLEGDPEGGMTLETYKANLTAGAANYAPAFQAWLDRRARTTRP